MAIQRSPKRKPTITITLKGGVIQDIDWPDSLKGLFQVITMDFDDPDPEDENYRETPDGTGYIEGVWCDPDLAEILSDRQS